jgi:hypothetical protein
MQSLHLLFVPILNIVVEKQHGTLAVSVACLSATSTVNEKI